jgi:cobalamin biosynthesis protein CobT
MASHIQEYHEASSPVAVGNCKRRSTDIAAVDDLSAAKRQKMANNDLEDAEEDEEEEETGTKCIDGALNVVELTEEEHAVLDKYNRDPVGMEEEVEVKDKEGEAKVEDEEVEEEEVEEEEVEEDEDEEVDDDEEEDEDEEDEDEEDEDEEDEDEEDEDEEKEKKKKKKKKKEEGTKYIDAVVNVVELTEGEYAVPDKYNRDPLGMEMNLMRLQSLFISYRYLFLHK